MIGKALRSIFGTKQDRDIKVLRPLVAQINGLEADMKKLSDEELQAQTPKFRKMLENGSTHGDILPEAFATVREASWRVLGLRPFDVQLIGAIVLHDGKIAEMKTGEGKTLTATLAMYLNALDGRGAHLVTVNDYLAERDAEWMGKLYNFLGLTTGVILGNMEDEERQENYNKDITYGTNNEFAFDYLRDNMKFDLDDYVQREFHYCIVDEVDSILIDEARTPLLISGPSEGDPSIYGHINKIIPKIEKEKHYTVDEKSRSAILTDEGVTEVQKQLGIENLYDLKNIDKLHAINQALRAHTLFKVDADYVVKDGEVIIVDEFTGRLKEGSRWSDGLHQAVEAKEGVKIVSENQTLASITFQNYFKMYSKLSGMTGTADTEAEEFGKIYKLEVIVVPTNLPMVRLDEADVVYKNKTAKYKAVAQMITELNKRKQPVLIGTITIESSEILSKHLTKAGVAHNVLNAKQHEREAEIVAGAGNPGMVTIATNMAGRGTDIKLTPETLEAGGLCIIGTERHESRRIDNQLRGRSGRQGDPGLSKFFLSLEDDLMRIFGSDRISGIMEKLGMEEDEPIEHKMISNAIAKAQKKVEGHNFDIRKHLLEYDDVMNEQRKVIYRLRREIISDQGNQELLFDFVEDVCHHLAISLKPEGKVPIDEWPWADITPLFKNIFHAEKDLSAELVSNEFEGNLAKAMIDLARNQYDAKFEEFEDDHVKLVLREILLSNFDSNWKQHLQNMDHLKEGINLRSYGQKDPLTEYKKEAFEIFEHMRLAVKRSIVEQIYSVQLYNKEELEELKRQQEAELKAQLDAHKRAQDADQRGSGKRAPVTRGQTKVSRNEPCPCGSGKKYKHCHGK
ncbi:MAG: preprotein translocase subunit SecA [Bacteriovoracaceae bacterium]|jgi:preprotein translocase subunit SecA|nr:preprotein translocase subunit SecA [Bacteriovoracaceae bacterium]